MTQNENNLQSHSPNWKKTFAIIYSGQAFSILGSSAIQFSIIWWLTVETNSAITLSLAAIAGFLPTALIGPIAGVWVDRYNRKKVMILADGFIALSSAALAIAFLMGTPSVGFIYFILFLRGLGSTFHSPAMQAAIPMLVPVEHLVKAGGWAQLVSSGSLMLGPVVGAFLMGLLPLSSIMLVDILGAAFAIITLLFVAIPNVEHETEELHILSDMKSAMAEIKNNVPLIKVTIPVLLACIVYMPIGALYPLLIYSHFNGTVWHNGLCEFLFAAGMLSSSLIMGIWGGSKRQFFMISLALVALGLCLGISGMLPPSAFVIFLILAFFMGGTGSFFNIPYMAYIQTSVSPAQMGKVISLVVSAMSFSMPIGLILAGPISEQIGINTYFFFSGIGMLFVGILCYFMTRKYDIDESA